MAPILLCVVGAKNSGKTTFIEAIVPLLKERGLRVGVVKHTHHEVQLDARGKDSWRHAQAGAEQVALMTPAGVAYFDYRPVETSAEAVIAAHFTETNLVLIEGYKWSCLPKIEIYRTCISEHPLCLDDTNLRAIVTDAPVASGVPSFSSGDWTAIADFVVGLVRHAE
jgi:molybdopterin-guanine dinucleotide biosynthesis protein B